MLTLRAIFPGDPLFPLVRSFVSRVYSTRLEVINPANPDAFAALFFHGTPIACAGIFSAATHKPLFFERFFDYPILEEIDPTGPRATFAELGALAIEAPEALSKHVQQIAALILIAASLIAYEEQITHLVFIGDRLLPRFSKLFGVPFHNFGRVEPHNIEPEFRAKLERYFRVGRNAYTVPTTPVKRIKNEIMDGLMATLGVIEHESMLPRVATLVS
ncbi:MAG TPA: thermostable hemolysin [Candidatus Paceibacterota bacterium]|nr:thermostable hemolysin [Candidatus Paceibacterota bacterium]